MKYSGKFYPKGITLYYYDRILKKLIKIPYEKIRLEDNFIIIDDSQIPIHRIYEIRNKNIIIWKRELKK
ncbi:DUF504 domain-containing protein [Candidatus Woesearchaeota archaeon]|nr:DUF504 domain-containing protein [Candidatus Woesearchaeota archaeon]